MRNLILESIEETEKSGLITGLYMGSRNVGMWKEFGEGLPQHILYFFPDTPPPPPNQIRELRTRGPWIPKLNYYVSN